MKKTELNEMAKNCLTRACAIAYYDLVDNDDDFYALSEEEKQFVLSQIDKYGKAMCKAINKKYYTL